MKKEYYKIINIQGETLTYFKTGLFFSESLSITVIESEDTSYTPGEKIIGIIRISKFEHNSLLITDPNEIKRLNKKRLLMGL